MSDKLSRRKLLRNSGAGALTVGMAAFAGCTSSIPFIGGDDVEFEGWLFTPSFSDVFDDDDTEIDDSQEQQKSFQFIVPEAVYDNEEDLDTHYPLRIGSDVRGKSGAAAIDTDWGLEQTVEWEYEPSSSYSRTAEVEVEVVTGEFDPDTVQENLEEWADDSDEYGDDDETELESAGSEADFDLYEIDTYAFGVSEDHLIQADVDSVMDPVAAVEAAIAAHEDGDGRWTEDEDGDELLSAFDNGDRASGVLGRPTTVETELENRGYDDPDEADEEEREEIRESIDEWEYGLVGATVSQEIDGDSTEIQEVYLYETEDDADSDALREHVEANRDYNEDWDTLEDYSIESDGRALILTGEVMTRAL